MTGDEQPDNPADARRLQRCELMLASMLRNLRVNVALQTRAAVAELQTAVTEPLSLIPHGYRVFSQNDEDGILAEIFRRIGVGGRRFIEIGAGTGLENNTLFLLHQNWRGAWFEAANTIDAAIEGYAPLLQTGQLTIRKTHVKPANVDALVRDSHGDGELDLLSLDIDGNDYHVLAAITCVQPRVMVLEYNAKFPPPIDYCMGYSQDHRYNGSDCFGASLSWLESRLAPRGYRLVGCNLTGSNAFFVREDLCGQHFLAPFTAVTHYQPPRYELSAGFADMSGHPPSYRTLTERVAGDDKYAETVLPVDR